MVAGREGRRFLLPGRQRIADALEEAAGKAEAEMQRAKQDAERKAAAMKQQVERDVEARGEAIQGQMKAEVEERGAEMQRRMQGEMEKRMQAAQADFERRTADMNATVQKTVEARVQEATQSFEKRLREMQDGMEQERKRMTQQLDSLGAIAAQTRRDVVPAATPPAHDDIDMAERFFPRTGWRSPVGLPLAVLGGMCVAGVAATAVVLMRRDTAGR
jgi:DNA anti-recombination protein RmuC